jgi:hypothetical protein
MILRLIFSLFICSFAWGQENSSDFRVLIVSADDSNIASEKKLEYSAMDAARLSRALVSSGKVPESHITNLKNPGIIDFDKEVDRVSKAAPQKFLFYFSGHSDENGLHLKDGSITKSKFHDLLAKVKSKIKVVLLDSCFSGALKSKGALISKPFDLVQYSVDEPTGSVILTSSSGTELSYESEKLKGSIFTYHLVSGLYGQADSNNDGLVTIDELYQYVYAQTKFQSAVSGGKIQSPEFNSNLKGQGALVLSYPARINGQIQLSKSVQGELTLASTKGINFFKFYKNKGEEKIIGLPKGSYDVTLLSENQVGTGQIEVAERSLHTLNTEGLVWQKRDIPSVRAKGVQPKFLFGVLLATHPAFRETEEGSTMGEFFLLSPSTEALKGRWRLSVHLGGEDHLTRGTNEKVRYSRMSIGGEGNYPGIDRLNSEWIGGFRIGTITSNNDSTNPTSASLTHTYAGARFYPHGMNFNWDLLFAIDGMKGGIGESKSVGTFGVAVSY